MRKLILYPLLGLLLSFGAMAQTNYPKTLLWRISGNGLQKTSYLYGTMHLQDRRLFYFTDSLYAYLEKAEGFAMEVDPGETMDALVKAMNEPDTSALLSESLDKEEFAAASKELENRYGVPAKKITRKQAWLFKMQGSYSRSKADDLPVAMDLYLYNIARRQGKWVGGIEDVADQLNLITDLSGKLDVTELLVKKGERAKQLEKLISIYRNGDLNSIDVWCNTGMSAEEREKMLYKRNIKMAFRMDSMAHVRSHFFAVGAAHLPGTAGVIDLLRKKGFQVEPVLSLKQLAPEQYTYTEKELPWYPFENEGKTYSVQMPGKALAYTEPKSGMRMHIGADLGSGLICFVAEMPVAAGKTDRETMAMLLQNMAKSKSTTPKQVAFQSMEVPEVDYEEKGNFYKLRIVPNGNEVLMLMTGGSRKELRDNKEALRFLNSISLAPAAAGTQNGWQLHASETKGYSIQFPGKPQTKPDPVNKDAAPGSWLTHTVSYFDVVSNAYFMVVTKETPVGYYIIDDQQLFEETKNSMAQNAGFEIRSMDTGRMYGYAAAWMDGSAPKAKAKVEALHVNRGNKAHSLMVIYDSLSTNRAAVKQFFESFTLLPFKTDGWQKWGGAGLPFTTTAPGALQPTEPDAESTMKGYTLAAYDPNSSLTFSVDVEAVLPFYWAVSDSAFFAEKSAEYIGRNDSLVYTADVQRGAAKGKEYLVRMGESGRNYKKLNIFLHGDSTYVLNLIAPKELAAANANQAFFNDFRFVNHKPNTSVLQPKAAALLQALTSADSATQADAAAFVESAPFKKSDLPLLHAAMLVQYPDSDDAYYGTFEKLRERVTEIGDESTVKFILENYAQQKGEKGSKQYELLRTLAGFKTAASFSALKTLLQTAPAQGEPGNLAYLLTDSLQLARSLFPEVQHLVPDSLFAEELVAVTNQLLDSAVIEKNMLVPFHNTWMGHAKKLLTALKGKDEEEGYNFYPWVSLLGKIGTPESNALLQQALEHPLVDLKQEVIVQLLQNGQSVQPAQVEKVAAQIANRASLYTELEKLGKISLFPSRYATQKSIAESEMYQAAYDEEPPSAVRFAGERKAMLEGKLQLFYLYKVVYEYEDGKTTYLGVSGGYTPGSKKLVSESKAIGFADVLTSDKEIDALFKKYLEETETNLAEQKEQ